MFEICAVVYLTRSLWLPWLGIGFALWLCWQAFRFLVWELDRWERDL